MIIAFFTVLLTHINISVTNLGEIFYILYCFFNILIKGKFKTNKEIRKYIFCTVLLIIYICFYFVFNIIDKSNIIKYAGKYLSMIIIVYLSYMQVRLNERNFRKFILWFSFFILINSLYISKYILNYSFISREMWHNFFPLLFLIALFQFREIENKYIIFYVLCMLIAVFGQSRTEQIAIVGLLIYSYFSHNKLSNSNSLIFLKKVLSLLFIFIIVYFSVNMFIYFLNEATASNIERYSLITSSVEIIKSNFIIGVGPGNFALYSNTYYGTMFPLNMAAHNYFLDTFAEFGIIGEILIVYPFIVLLRNTIKKLRVDTNILYKYLFLYLQIVLLFNVMSGENRLVYSIIFGVSFSMNDNQNPCILESIFKRKLCNSRSQEIS